MSDDIDKAVRILREGGLVAFPTETVYGLGADATQTKAVERIFAAKSRPPSNPLIVHVADARTAERYTEEPSWRHSHADILAKAFWPGPLTLILPKSAAITHVATAGRQSVGLRVPDHPLALELLVRFGGAIAAPSANRSTRVSPTTAQHVHDELGDKVDLILDGGPCLVGIESTVLDLTGRFPTILRPGAITVEDFEPVIGHVRVVSGSIDLRTPAASPGQQAVHYAPRAAAFRYDKPEHLAVANWTHHTNKYCAILAINREGFHYGPTTHSITMPDDPQEYARVLYAKVRDLDARSIDILFIEMPPEMPEWLAVRDRLMRATKPFPPDLI